MTQEISVLDAASNELEIIEFYIEEVLADGSRYTSYFGMNVAKVLSIIRRPVVTGVPGNHHPAALGTFNLRGRVLPLVDLAMWLGKKTEVNDNWKVIVTEFAGWTTAFLVSGVTRIHRMTWSQVEPPGKHLQTFSHDCITGVVRFENRIVFLLDMEQVISSMNPKLSMEAQTEHVDAAGIGEGYTILMADDSASVRHTIAKALARAGFTVIQTTCGREAWDELVDIKKTAAAENKPLTEFVNLIISDIEMPEMDGHALTRKIKDDPELKTLPVILFSSLISEVVLEKGRQAGADAQLSKPDLPELALRAGKIIKEFQGGK
ncbi:Chemotaxis protein CheV [uncultured delta proteobacterium]|uniref:Chemotaxis protein CheV n=1 Tax=uncultured delta proteobacterium TaxID=34034 RepID=A0A212JYB6_9DELT|nr:Chemotaxis protein CheV [uncultured delta proteobacterium]